MFIDLIQTPVLKRLLGRPQRWRWVARNGSNFRVLAVSSENYTNKSDCVAAIEQLFGTGSDVYRREPETGNVRLRLATPPSGQPA